MLGYRILGMQKGEKEEIQTGIGTSQEERQRGMFKFKDEFNFRCLKKKKQQHLRIVAAIKPK